MSTSDITHTVFFHMMNMVLFRLMLSMVETLAEGGREGGRAKEGSRTTSESL